MLTIREELELIKLRELSLVWAGMIGLAFIFVGVFLGSWALGWCRAPFVVAAVPVEIAVAVCSARQFARVRRRHNELVALS